MKVIAIDPGYDRLGAAILEKSATGQERLIYSECYLTNPKEAFAARLSTLCARVDETIKKHAPGIMALELLYITKNQKTAMRVSEVRGALIYLAALHGLTVFEYTPREVKCAVCGDGNASKRQISTMIPRLIQIQKEPRYDDEYDAIAVGLTALATLRADK